MSGRRWCRAMLLVLFASGLIGATAKGEPTATAAVTPRSVTVDERGFTPAVVEVPIGTVVQWRNDGTGPHSLIGQVQSPGDLPPGQTYQRRFTKPGEYVYADGHHPDAGGTVVVIAGSGHPGHARGIATYHYSASFQLSVDDQWTYYDPVWQSKTGPCNGQVGSGERLIHLDVRVPHVTYSRYPRLGIEILTSRATRSRFREYTETIKSKVAEGTSQLVTCPDGNTDRTADQQANCSHNYTGKPVLLTLGWGPTATKNRFQFSNGGPPIQPGSCGSNIVGALSLVGVKDFVLPLNLVGSEVDYDEGNTSPATHDEVSAIRAGHAFTVNRRVELNFTTPCCEGFNPNNGGVLARIANIHHYVATLVIRFTPRGRR